MTGNKELVCIVCPMGCRMSVSKAAGQEEEFRVSGNQCKRGIDYAQKELTNPTRMIPTTVKIKDAALKRLPVITETPVPKELIFKCMSVINSVEVTAPVKLGEVIIENICNTGVNVVATRSMEKKSVLSIRNAG